MAYTYDGKPAMLEEFGLTGIRPGQLSEKEARAAEIEDRKPNCNRGETDGR